TPVKRKKEKKETHLGDEEHRKYHREWVGQIFFSSHPTTKRGVITLNHKNLPFTVTSSCKDTKGRYILVSIMHSENILLADMDCPNMIIGDDFNCALYPMMDRSPSQTVISKNAKAALNINKEFDLLDIWSYLNTHSKQYTFHSQPHSSASCIDYIFTFHFHLVEQLNIGHIALSDHAPVVMSIQPLKSTERSFSWRMNTTLLMDKKFINYLNDQADLFLEFNDKDAADSRIVWGTYEAYMRGMIISYTSRRKKERVAKQFEIERKIKRLEEDYYVTKREVTLIEMKATRIALHNLVIRKLFYKQKKNHSNRGNAKAINQLRQTI
uniref:Endonuclease/exonuclease/phosphatase domain-containing protein n=1 Tax=Echeneis naucrates TaxID=173247 RepID=A0A665UG82_ECHNA